MIDLFNIVSTLIGCANKVSKAKEANAKMENAESEVKKAIKKVTDYENIIKTGVSL